jgi:hypothetical protein
MEFISIPISVVSLVISAITFWIVFLRRGRLKMTTPTVVFFGYDHTPTPTAKVFIRTLLYSTAARGAVIEGMYARIKAVGSDSVFSFWGYGETEKLTVGSGLYVSQTGFSANHHFVSSVQGDVFEFKSGQYRIEIFAREVGKKRPTRLNSVDIELSDQLSEILSRHEGVLFEKSIEGEYIGRGRE